MHQALSLHCLTIVLCIFAAIAVAGTERANAKHAGICWFIGLGCKAEKSDVYMTPEGLHTIQEPPRSHKWELNIRSYNGTGSLNGTGIPPPLATGIGSGNSTAQPNATVIVYQTIPISTVTETSTLPVNSSSSTGRGETLQTSTEVGASGAAAVAGRFSALLLGFCGVCAVWLM